MQSFTFDLPAGQSATITTDVYCTSSYAVIGDPDNAPTAPVTIDADDVITIGAFSTKKRYEVFYSGSTPTLLIQFAGGTVGDDDSDLAPLASPTFTGTVTLPTPFKIGSVSMTATGTQLNYVAGVTSAIQTQLNNRALVGATVIAPVTDGAELAAVPNTAAAVNAIITALIAAGILHIS